MFMGEHPLGQVRVQEVDGSLIEASKSRKIYQVHKWKGKITVLKFDQTAPCAIDEFVNSDRNGYCGTRRRCTNCSRLVRVSSRPKE